MRGKSGQGDTEAKWHGEIVGRRDSWSPLLLVALSFQFLALNPSESGAAPQEVVPIDGAVFRGNLVSIDAEGRVTFQVANAKDKKGDTRTVPLDHLIRWGNPVAPRAQPIVVLADGGRIVTAANWGGGAAVRLAGDDVLLLSDIWNEVRLPRTLVRGIVFAQQNRVEEREKLVEQLENERAPDPSLNGTANASADVVTLTNGNRLSGKLTELERGSLAIETLGDVAKLPLSRVDAIRLRNNRDPSAVGRQGLLIGVRDGSEIHAKTIRADDKELAVKLDGGLSLKGGDMNDVVAIQLRDNSIAYLSDLDGADYRNVPYLTVNWPFMRDKNVLGGPLVVRGRRYWKGIGMHSAVRLTFKLDRDYRRFDAAAALDDSAKGRGSVTFGAYVQRDGKWAEAFKTGIVRGGDAPQPVSIDLRGAKGLTLTVDFADRGDELDHAVWLDARLVR